VLGESIGALPCKLILPPTTEGTRTQARALNSHASLSLVSKKKGRIPLASHPPQWKSSWDENGLRAASTGVSPSPVRSFSGDRSQRLHDANLAETTE